jgi:hypothetical protein
MEDFIVVKIVGVQLPTLLSSTHEPHGSPEPKVDHLADYCVTYLQTSQWI